MIVSEYISNINNRRFSVLVIAVIAVGIVSFSCAVSAEDKKYEFVISDEQMQEIREAQEAAMERRKIEREKRIEIKEAFEAVEEIDRIDSYEQFMSTYPDSAYEKYAKIKIETLEFKDAVKQRTVEALDAFMSKYPESMNFRSAKYKRARILDDVDEYNAYMLEYSDAEGVKYYRDRAALKAAKKIGTLEVFAEFIKLYPDSDWLGQAVYQRDRAALKVAEKIGTKEAFGEFIELYPDSDWLDRAKYFYKHGYGDDDE